MPRHAPLLASLVLTAAVSAFAFPAAAAPISDPRLIEGQPFARTRYHHNLPFVPLDHLRGLRIGEHLTCSRLCKLRLDDGTVVTLSPGAEVAGASPTFHRFDDEEMARRCMALEVVSGEVAIERAAVPKPFVLQTASGVVVTVEEGTARVAVHADRTAVVTSEEGAAYDRARRWVPLAPHQLHVVRPQGRVESHPVVTPPIWQRDDRDHRPLGLAVKGPHSAVGGAWKPIPGAAGYIVEIATDATFATMTKRLELDGEAEHFQISLPEGRYETRVTATDVEGMVSATSAPMAMRVVRAAMPEGGFMPDARVMVVPEESHVRLLDVNDLQVSIDSHGFLPAPTELMAPARDHHQVAIRMASDPRSETVFRLEKRALQAQVQMTPRLPAWPEDDIQATVRLADPSGHIDPATFVPALEVRIAGAPVAARWERHGATWRTSIDGRFLDGPSLVEVLAKDDRGKWLGWGFVEVVSRRR